MIGISILSRRLNKKIEAQIEEHCQHDNMVNIYLGKVVVSYVFLALYIRCFLNLGPKALDIGTFILAPKLKHMNVSKMKHSVV